MTEDYHYRLQRYKDWKITVRGEISVLESDLLKKQKKMLKTIPEVVYHELELNYLIENIIFIFIFLW